MNNDYALIIGVHDYRAYDPTGAANVPGARRDALTWYRTCLSMGFSPENIRVLASPPLEASDLGPEGAKTTLGEATRAGIASGLAWLSERIDGALPASGLMTFSGHGDEGEHGFPVLCPSDTTSSLEEVIDVGALRRNASAQTKDNLTIMLDCCHAEAGRSAAESLRARLAAKNAGRPAPDAPRCRVVAACGRDQQSVSARFLGEEMGAFTWAAASALGQWKVVVEHGVAELDVSYGNLLTRTRSLLSALSFAQEPVLSGPPGVANLAFLHPGTSGERGETTRAPTATRKGHQLDGGQISAGSYQRYEVWAILTESSEALMGYIYVTTTDTSEALPMIGNTRMQPGTEYWVFYGRDGVLQAWEAYYSTMMSLRLPPSSGYSSKDIRVEDYAYYFQATESTSWPSGNTSLPPDSFVFSGGTGVVKGAAFQFKDGTPFQWWWLQTGTGNLTPEDLGAATLYPQEKAPPSADTYAASTFTPFDPNG